MSEYLIQNMCRINVFEYDLIFYFIFFYFIQLFNLQNIIRQLIKISDFGSRIDD